MTGCWKTRIAAAVLLMGCGLESVAAGPMPTAVTSDATDVLPVQDYGYGYPAYGYGRPYGYYRPYGHYRPYGYGPGPRYYNNHFGPGAAKERYRTRLDYCMNRPERC